jgi:predicted ester cyclase
LNKVCNKGEIKLISEIFAKKVCFNGKRGKRKNVRNYLQEIKDAFEKPHVKVNRELAEEDRVSTMRTWKGVQVKEYHGHPPTNILMTWTEMSVVRLVNGKIVEDWVVQGELTIAP